MSRRTIRLEVNEQDVKTLLAALKMFGEDWLRYLAAEGDGPEDRGRDWPMSAASLSVQIKQQARLHDIPVQEGE